MTNDKRTETHACDLISRQAAIDALDKVAEMFPYRIPGKPKTYRQYNEAWGDAVDAAENAIEALPSVQPGWIPVTERLPKDEEEVIVSIHDDSGDYAYDYTSSGWYAAAGEFWVVDNEASMRVVAWKPMPTPYREGGQS